MTDLDLETRHRIAVARELTYAAGCPLRDRHGFASPDEHVELVLGAVFTDPSDYVAAYMADAMNARGDIEIAMGTDTPADEEYLLRVVRSLRPLVEQRRKAAERALG